MPKQSKQTNKQKTLKDSEPEVHFRSWLRDQGDLPKQSKQKQTNQWYKVGAPTVLSFGAPSDFIDPKFFIANA